MQGSFKKLFELMLSFIMAPFHILKFLISNISSFFIRIITIFAVLIAIPSIGVIAYHMFDYNKNSYKYTRSENCNIYNEMLGDVKLDFEYSCIDASKYKESNYHNFLLFMSSEDNPTPARTGHGWLALARVSKSNAIIRVHEWRVFGFWGDNQFKCSQTVVSIYNKIAPWLPFRGYVEQNYKSFCMGGVSDIESNNVISNNKEGVIISKISDISQVHNLLARRPSQLLAVVIDNEQFNNVQWLSSESKRRDYSVLLSDCTTLLYKIADSAGLYTPPRVLFPYPSQSVEALRNFNTK